VASAKKLGTGVALSARRVDARLKRIFGHFFFIDPRTLLTALSNVQMMRDTRTGMQWSGHWQ
jgi:hypothetical protein